VSLVFGRIQQKDVCFACRTTVTGGSELVHEFASTVRQSEGERKTTGIVSVCGKPRFKVYRKGWEKRKENPVKDLWQRIFWGGIFSRLIKLL